MVDLAKVFSSELCLTKDINNLYMVWIRRVAWKENPRDIMARSIVGRGMSVEEACSSFLNEARGKLLFGDDRLYYGENRPEFICV
jgi:hypothetical protein